MLKCVQIFEVLSLTPLCGAAAEPEWPLWRHDATFRMDDQSIPPVAPALLSCPRLVFWHVRAHAVACLPNFHHHLNVIQVKGKLSNF